jgi:hypothetical protein
MSITSQGALLYVCIIIYYHRVTSFFSQLAVSSEHLAPAAHAA